MAKAKTGYFCQHCGTQHSKWMGRCTACGEWNTIAEEVVQKTQGARPWQAGERPEQPSDKPLRISQIDADVQRRLSTPDAEFNRVLGGGITAGSVSLLGGEPGIGKSTLLLQLALQLRPHHIFYVSGEESALQIKHRAARLEFENENLLLFNETQTQRIFQHIGAIQPDLVIIDSIQTLQTDRLEASPGTVSQIRESTAELIRFSKETHIPVMLIGHITKEGQLAGPKVLEHMVDTVLQFEGDQNHAYRILRVLKNRFGATAELGIYEMLGNGLRAVSQPSEILLSKREEQLSGNGIAAILEGMRPLLVEIQALVSSAVYGTPQRSATGYDSRRLNMLLAVLEKRAGFKLAAKDVFLNVTGGIRVDDPALDLAVVSAVLSSSADIPIPPSYCFTGEVGLSGEIRPVTRVEQRISEAAKLGFEKIFVSKYNKLTQRPKGIQLLAVSKVEDVFNTLFG